MQEHYLVIVGKREESKVLGCVWICLGENLERKRERICLENCPKSSSSSCDCGEKRRIKGAWMCLDMFRREFREEKRKDLLLLVAK